MEFLKIQKSEDADSVFLPANEPLDQRAHFTESAQLAIDGILISPDHVGQFAICDARFDLAAIESEIALDVEAVGSAGDRSVKINRACTA